MKNSLTVLLIVVSTSIAYAQPKTAPVNEVLKNITDALNEIEHHAELPAPAKVNVTFKTEVAKSTNAGISILIFKFGKKWTRQQSNEVSYNFTLVNEESFEKGDIKEELAKVIKSAIDEALNVENQALKLTDFSVQISFVLERTNELGGGYEIIPLPITPELGRSWKKKAVHTIKISFEK